MLLLHCTMRNGSMRMNWGSRMYSIFLRAECTAVYLNNCLSSTLAVSGCGRRAHQSPAGRALQQACLHPAAQQLPGRQWPQQGCPPPLALCF